jgi:hypothetical protein
VRELHLRDALRESRNRTLDKPNPAATQGHSHAPTRSTHRLDRWIEAKTSTAAGTHHQSGPGVQCVVAVPEASRAGRRVRDLTVTAEAASETH